MRALALYPAEEPLIASAGLDRFLRLHNTTTKASAGRVYLKQQLTCVCWLPVKQLTATTQQAAGQAQQHEAAGLDGDVGNAAGNSKDKKKKKKRKQDKEDHSPIHKTGGSVGSKKQRSRSVAS